MKKIISLIALLLSSVILFTAVSCSGGGGKSERKDLIVTISDDDKDIEIQIALQNAFVKYMKEKGTDVEVTYNTYTSSTYSQDLLSLQAGRALGDVIQTSDRFSSLFAYKKVFEPLDGFIADDSSFALEDYDEEIIESARSYNNKIYYMPRSYDQVVIFINTDFFNAIGVDYPKPDTSAEDPWAWWTWDKCIELCQQIREAVASSAYSANKDYVYPMDANVFWNPVYNAIIKSFGGKTVDAETLTTGFDSNDSQYAETLKAMEFIKSLVTNKYTSSSNDTRFLAKRGAINCAGMWFTTRPNVLTCLNNNINLAFAPIPRFTETQTEKAENTTYIGYGSAGYAISAMSSQKTLAWEFVKFCASAEGQGIISANGASVPTLNNLKSLDASWVNPVKVNGQVVDQSAFLYDGHTRTLSTYARGINAEVEYMIYQSVQSKIISGINNVSAAAICTDIYATIRDYIKK